MQQNHISYRFISRIVVLLLLFLFLHPLTTNAQNKLKPLKAGTDIIFNKAKLPSVPKLSPLIPSVPVIRGTMLGGLPALYDYKLYNPLPPAKGYIPASQSIHNKPIVSPDTYDNLQNGIYTNPIFDSQEDIRKELEKIIDYQLELEDILDDSEDWDLDGGEYKLNFAIILIKQYGSSIRDAA